MNNLKFSLSKLTSLFLVVFLVFNSFKTFASSNSPTNHDDIIIQFHVWGNQLSLVNGELQLGYGYHPELYWASDSSLISLEDINQFGGLRFNVQFETDCDFNISTNSFTSGSEEYGVYVTQNIIPNDEGNPLINQVVTLNSNAMHLYYDHMRNNMVFEGAIPNVIFEGQITHNPAIVYGDSTFYAQGPCGNAPIPATCCTIRPVVNYVKIPANNKHFNIIIADSEQEFCHPEVVFPPCIPGGTYTAINPQLIPISNEETQATHEINEQNFPSIKDKYRRQDAHLVALQINPNPTHGNFELSIPGYAFKGEISIQNISGQVLQHFQIGSLTTKVQLSSHGLSPGIYIVQWKDNDLYGTQKLIVH